MRCAATLSAPYTSMPIQHSHTASLTQARHESGGIVSERRLQGLISGTEYAAIAISCQPSPRARRLAP